jgi:membrane protein DedA with SNARE-associated domain
MEFFQTILDWYMANLNYFTVGLLMLIESTFLPMPSEVVIPFAAYKAAQGDLNVFLVVIAGTIGALCGSLINYLLAYYLGRPLVYSFADSRVGKLFLLSKEKVIKAEIFFLKNGKASTFIGRLVPGIRHLISIPAGLAKMNLRDFMLYTFIGAGIWNIILAVIGYYAYELKEKIFPFLDEALYVLGAIFIIYLIVRAVLNKRKNNKKSEPSNELQG